MSFRPGSVGVFPAEWLSQANLAQHAEVGNNSAAVSVLPHRCAAFGLKQELQSFEKFF